jgi:hypothetical protein
LPDSSRFDHLAATIGDPLLNKPMIELTDDEARSAFEVDPGGRPLSHDDQAHQIR